MSATNWLGWDDSGVLETRPWIRVSLIEHYVYCPRQAVLITREPWSDNRATAQGTVLHSRVDSGLRDHRHGLTIHHAVPLIHQGLRLHGVADTVEEHADGRLIPVEHKSGRSGWSRSAAAIQVAAQAVCLAEMTDRPVPLAALYFAKDNARLDVDVTSLIDPLHQALRGLRRDLESTRLPPWTSRRTRCRHCSLKPSCMPELARMTGST